MIVYITTQGSRLVREGRHLLVRKENDIHHTLFTHKLEQVVICGNVTITPPAMRLLLSQNIDTIFLRKDGRYIGGLALPEPENVFVRKLQFMLTADDDFCLKTARSILKGKLTNMATVMQRIKRTRQAPAAGRAAGEIRELAEKLEKAPDLEVVRGLEGRAGTIYFQAFKLGLAHDWGFYKRVRRPPTDPVNAVLSLLYTFLINRMLAAIRLAGLDPYPGVLHSLEYGRHSLALDLVEEFRSMLADTLAMSLFNLGVLKRDDFMFLEPAGAQAARVGAENMLDEVCRDPMGRMDFDQAEGVFDISGPQTPPDSAEETARDGKHPVQLKPEAFKRVINAFEKKVATEFMHPAAEKRMSYAEAMVFQARVFRRLVEGQIALYQPLFLR